MVSLPILAAFGLIFKDKFSEMGMPVKDISTITSTNSACSMLIGVVNGPLLKNFGYRKVASGAGLMFVTGVALTAFANSFYFFILSYSILTGMFSRLVFNVTLDSRCSLVEIQPPHLASSIRRFH